MRGVVYLDLAVVHCSNSGGAMSGEIKMGGSEEVRSGEIERGMVIESSDRRNGGGL